jgi:hypothetical protein
MVTLDSLLMDARTVISARVVAQKSSLCPNIGNHWTIFLILAGTKNAVCLDIRARSDDEIESGGPTGVLICTTYKYIMPNSAIGS